MTSSAATATPARTSSTPRGGTIPQRLLLMNGDLVREKTKDDLFNASRRIAELAPDDRQAVEIAYLAVLTRRPTPEELAHFAEPARRAPRARSGRTGSPTSSGPCSTRRSSRGTIDPSDLSRHGKQELDFMAIA